MLKVENGTAQFDGNFETVIDDYATVVAAMVEFVKTVMNEEDDEPFQAGGAVIAITKRVIDDGYTCNGKEVVFDEKS